MHCIANPVTETKWNSWSTWNKMACIDVGMQGHSDNAAPIMTDDALLSYIHIFENRETVNGYVCLKCHVFSLGCHEANEIPHTV
jgi:hypothetical protein